MRNCKTFLYLRYTSFHSIQRKFAKVRSHFFSQKSTTNFVQTGFELKLEMDEIEREIATLYLHILEKMYNHSHRHRFMVAFDLF